VVSNQLAKIAKELVRVGQLAKELVRVGGFIRGFALAHSNAEMSGSPDISGDDVCQGDERVMTIIFVMTRSSFDTCGTRSSFDTRPRVSRRRTNHDKRVGSNWWFCSCLWFR